MVAKEKLSPTWFFVESLNLRRERQLYIYRVLQGIQGIQGIKTDKGEVLKRLLVLNASFVYISIIWSTLCILFLYSFDSVWHYAFVILHTCGYNSLFQFTNNNVSILLDVFVHGCLNIINGIIHTLVTLHCNGAEFIQGIQLQRKKALQGF